MPPDLSVELAGARLKGGPADLTKRLDTIRAAHQRGEFGLATALMRDFVGVKDSFLRVGALKPGALPASIKTDTVTFDGKPLGLRVDFEETLVHLRLSLPILKDGTALTGSFGYFAYPEKYLELFTESASGAFQQLSAFPNQIQNIIITPLKDMYYHTLLDTLPHLAGALQGENPADHSFVHPHWVFTSPWEKQVLEHFLKVFNLTDLKIMGVKVDALKAGHTRMVTPAPLSGRLAVLDRLRVATSEAPDAPYLYFQRNPTDSRRLQNEAELIERLGPRFQVVRPDELDFVSQIQLATQAKCIVGVHGSNLANIAFCVPGAALVELSAGVPQPFYEGMAKEKFMPYRRVEGMFDHSGEAPTPDFHLDFIVDVDQVVEAVDQVLSAS